MTANRRDAYVEDVEHLHWCGLAPERIAQRVGLAAASLQRAMYRAGRHDLARLFSLAANTARRKTCACGQPCDRRSSRCWDCRRIGPYQKRAE